jgi:hypothetical protein
LPNSAPRGSKNSPKYNIVSKVAAQKMSKNIFLASQAQELSYETPTAIYRPVIIEQTRGTCGPPHRRPGRYAVSIQVNIQLNPSISNFNTLFIVTVLYFTLLLLHFLEWVRVLSLHR